MRTALLYGDGNFIGREYYRILVSSGLPPDLLVAVGAMSEESVAREVARTGGLWNPPSIPESAQVFRFSSLRDPALWRLLQDSKIDLALQGGVGILKPDMLAVPTLGFLNVHPGRLPQYRGNMCPERAVLNGDEVWATAHMVDHGIDTGPTVASRKYEFHFVEGYAAFRANLYAHCARVLVDAINMLSAAENPREVPVAQSPEDAAYWAPLTPDEYVAVQKLFSSASA